MEQCKQSFHIWNAVSAKLRAVGLSLQQQLGQFLRRKRGTLSYSEFSRKTRIPVSTLYRLERAEQGIQLGKLEVLLKKLKVSIRDVFPE